MLQKLNQKSLQQVGARPAAVRSTVVCKASTKGDVPAPALSLAAASFAAGVMLSLAPPSEAGVVYSQPQLKRFGEAVPAKETTSAPSSSSQESGSAGPKLELPKGEPIELGEDPFDVRLLALPGAVGAIGALFFALSKVDTDFPSWIATSGAVVRNSDEWLGFEEEIKETNPYTFDGVFPSKNSGGGGKKATPKKSTTVKGGTTKKGTQIKGGTQKRGGGDDDGPSIGPFKLPFGKN